MYNAADFKIKEDVFVLKSVINYNNGVVEKDEDFWFLLNTLYKEGVAVPVEQGLFIINTETADAMVKEALK